MRRFRVGLISVLVTTALACATMVLSDRSASAASHRAPGGVKFRVDYRGTVSGTWRNTWPVGSGCIGSDESGSFTSTVRSSAKPYFLIVYKDLGGRIVELDWREKQPNGIVTSVRTAQGWMMGFSGGQCTQVPINNSGCRSNSFAGWAAVLSESGNLAYNRSRVYLSWEAEPGVAIDCSNGIVYDHRTEAPFGQRIVTLDHKRLFRCGTRKGRRCVITIGGATDYPYHVTTRNNATYTSNVHTEWSVTFRAVRR